MNCVLRADEGCFTMVNERVFLFGGPSQPFVAGVMEAQPLDPGLTPLLLGEGQTGPESREGGANRRARGSLLFPHFL